MAFPVTYTPEPSRPSGGAQPGTKTLLGWIVSPTGWDAADAFDDQDPTNLGIYNPRDVCGNQWPNWKCKGSQHARGAAGDAGFPIVTGGHPEGHKLATWLVAYHAELGVQEVIWAERRWHNGLGWLPFAKWPKYTGRSKHLDHVHFAQNDAGAKGLTLEMILAVAPKPPGPTPTPEPAPTMEDDRMFLARCKGTAEVWLIEPGRMSHVESGADQVQIARALGLPDDEAEISLGTWEHVINGRKQYRNT